MVVEQPKAGATMSVAYKQNHLIYR